MTTLNKNTNLLILFSVLLAVFVVPSSISGTAIALPYISADMQSDLASLQWVVNAFNLTFACFTLIWGKLSDIFGRKRSFIAGALIYTLASVGSFLANNALWLDIFRALAGVGGAAIFSCGSAIFVHVFEGNQRTKAFALFGTTAGLGITLGPTISGLLLEMWSWQVIFAMHAVALFSVLLVSTKIPSDEAADVRLSQVDFLGSLLFISSMFLLMLALSKGYDWGWESSESLLTLASGAILFILFLIRAQLAKNPVLNLSLLKNRKFLGFILVPVVASFTFVTLLTYFPTYLTGPMQLPASKAGLMMIFLTSPVLIFPLIAGKLASRGVSSKLLMYISILSMLIGTSLLLSSIDIVLNLPVLSISLLLIGIGMGMSAGLVDGEALSCVDSNEIGMAAGLLNTFRLGSEAIAVALYGSLLSSTLSEIVPVNLRALELPNIGEWVNSITSGNFVSMVEATSGVNQEFLLKEVIRTYNYAFTATNVVLGSIALLVSLMVFGLLRKEPKRSPAEASDI
ncbi:hypothetical protein BZG00_02770 [Salinivibrio kushneri]|uniref:Major facilitator superfamily (MFS) profile domain-containing protein n=1 Tax=Salinivibrio kushneri TaxID=1908198 RepID=A0AB36K2E0_9GAMM|nr:MFS transporter [Salinivibrio kushneri]OOE41037.1 hypothetical protein BZG00_02770 [Salinivibrio kushneri]QCP01642.1 MFS transporter [Salinivibrio kushneri]